MSLSCNPQILNTFNKYNNVVFRNLTGLQATRRNFLTKTPDKDAFISNPLDAPFGDKETLTRLVKKNPQIMKILDEYNIKLNLNTEALAKLKTGHLLDTRITAARMYSELPKELRNQINLSDLQQAAMYHDYGKIFIPKEILNKKGALSPKEKEIMQLHSELGAELLKQQGINNNVVNLVRYHHQTPSGNGYPKYSNNYKPDLTSEILASADKYSALREARSYKKAFNREDALNVIKEDVFNRNIRPEVYQALAKAV